jgi:hypothetical protein
VTAQAPVGAAHGVGVAEVGLEPHEPAVQLLAVGIDGDRALQGRERAVPVAGLVAEVGEPCERVHGPAPQVDPGRLRPGVVGVGEQVAAVGGRRPLQRGQLVGRGGGVLGVGECPLEAPQVHVDQVRVDPVALVGALQHLEVRLAGCATQAGAEAVDRVPKPTALPAGLGVGP